MRGLPLLAGALAAWSLLAPAAASAQAREVTLEHDGSVGVIAGFGSQYSVAMLECDGCGSDEKSILGFDALLEVGGTLAVGQAGGEISLRGRLAFLSPARGESLLLGYRRYFGKDELKTVASFDLMGTFRPVQTLGVRAGFGLMWDFSPIMGVWSEAGGTFGVGAGRRFGAELLVGLQGRSYLLE